MKFETRMTLSSANPNCAPPCRSVAQLPGSMYPTATRKPGPENAASFRQKETPAAGTRTLRFTSGREASPSVLRQMGRDGAVGGMILVLCQQTRCLSTTKVSYSKHLFPPKCQ